MFSIQHCTCCELDPSLIRAWSGSHWGVIRAFHWGSDSRGQHGAHLGPVGPRWAPCWPHEPCYQGCLPYTSYHSLISIMGFSILVRWHLYIESWPRLRCGVSFVSFKFDLVLYLLLLHYVQNPAVMDHDMTHKAYTTANIQQKYYCHHTAAQWRIGTWGLCH